MAKLHEILAVEGDKEGYFKKSIPEMINLFKNKVNQFHGHTRTLQLIGEDTPEKLQAEQAEADFLKIMTTVPGELGYLASVFNNYVDVVYQKDEANQRARADIIVDGLVIAADVPATTLLGLENKLKQLRTVVDEIPTLQPGVNWVLDPAQGDYIYRDSHPEIRTKTKKTFDYKVIVPPTDKHPAQIDKYESTQDVGYFTKIRWSGCVSVARKSTYLERVDKLIQAVKQARQRANEVEVNTEKKVGFFLTKYILGEKSPDV